MVVNSSIFRLLVLCFLAWGGLFYSTIESTVAIWYRSETFAHCFIILPICIYLIKLRWRQLNEAVIRPNYKVILFILPVIGIWLLGSLANLLVLEQAAVFLVLPLVIWVVLGNQVARLLAFTLAFWMFSVPVGEFLVPELQDLTADITVWALQMSGIPIYREGLYLAVPGGLFEVAAACSGIRYLIASFTLGTLYAYLNYNSKKKRIFFIIFSIALPLIANGIRAYGIVLIAYLSDMKYATGVDHLVYGWVFFGFVILVMFAIGNIWADPIEESDKEPETKPNTASVLPSVYSLMAVAAVIGLSYTYKLAIENPEPDVTPDLESVFVVESEIADTSWQPKFRNASTERKGHQNGTDYYLAYYDRNIQGQELINETNIIYNGERWTIVSNVNHGSFRLIQITNTGGKFRLIAYSYANSWMVSPSAIKVKLSQAFQAFLGIPQTGIVLIMSKEMTNVNREEVTSALVEQASEVYTPSLRKLFQND